MSSSAFCVTDKKIIQIWTLGMNMIKKEQKYIELKIVTKKML